MPEMKMRPSRVLERLREGKVALSFKLNLSCPRVADIVAMSGFDCVWVDMEHVANGWSVVESQIYAARGHGADVMVRVARGSYSDYVRPLELDAAGIMVPHVMSADDAKSVVRMTRFHPVGRRPADGGNADGAYCGIDFPSYLEQANANRFVILQIEDPEPMHELDAICAVEGYDVVFFGPGDFSHGLGVPGQSNHPALKEARVKIAKAAQAHGKFAGTVGGIKDVPELVAMGYRFINVGADVIGLSAYCREIVESVAPHLEPS